MVRVGMKAVWVAVIVTTLLASALGQGTQTPATPPPATGPAFDVQAAVNAYLAKVPPDAKARSDAYFEGGYWMQLWDFVLTVVIMLLLLQEGISRRMRDWAERVTRFRPLQRGFYWLQFMLLTTVIAFPLTVYEGYYRERRYGLMNQTFGSWFGDQAIGFALTLVFGGLLVMALFWIVRKLGKNWWIWGAAATIVFFMIGAIVAPVYIAPLFNTYKKLADPKIKASILSLARANGIPVTEVYQVDASRQSNRISANVSGFLGTERITLNDNLLNRCTPEQIQSVMGHEMGHYVLNHAYKGVMEFGILIVLGFAFLNWSLNWSLVRWGERWGIRGILDPAVLPLATLLLSAFFFALTPVTNTLIRTQEYEADIFGLNAAGQPDGEAEVDLMLGEYRKLDPGPVEELLFFDHPSGRTRITAAMRWKAEHMGSAQVSTAHP
jgi:STE24 endopeptidase